MKLRKLLLAGSILAATAAVPAQASIIDNPQFRVLGLVIVWGAGDATTGGSPVVSDFIIDDAAGAGDTDLIDADDVFTVLTGTLTPVASSPGQGGDISIDGTIVTDGNGVLDAADDQFSAFTLTDTTDVDLNGLAVQSDFFVASNTAFNISAVASADTEVGFSLADISYSMDAFTTATGTTLANFGTDAQLPFTDPAVAFPLNGQTLDQIAGGNVFVGSQLTAATPGSISSQSVRFQNTYTLGATGAYDLSQGTGEVAATVTYTVFVP